MTLQAIAVVSTALVFMTGCKKEKDAPEFIPLGGDDTLFLETHTTTNSIITGMLWVTSSSEVAPFSLIKQ